MTSDVQPQDVELISNRVIGSAIEVHRTLGPGLLESVYREGCVVVELKAIEQIHPVHLAQVITYLKLSGYPVGLIMNFNVTSLRAGLRRLDHPDRYSAH